MSSLAPQVNRTAELPLLCHTLPEWGRAVLEHPIPLLIDHAFLEKKAANNALDMLTRWPGEDVPPGWVETMTGVARDEASHLAQVVRLLARRSGRLCRFHKSTYANALRALVRKGRVEEIVDRLLVSALIEARSCERFGVLAEVCEDQELAAFYKALYSSELGHYKVFLKLAARVSDADGMGVRWSQLLEREADIVRAQPPGIGIHSGIPSRPSTLFL
jgi:tRNA-(ms[2]io[6]A)-hydroxylase